MRLADPSQAVDSLRLGQCSSFIGSKPGTQLLEQIFSSGEERIATMGHMPDASGWSCYLGLSCFLEFGNYAVRVTEVIKAGNTVVFSKGFVSLLAFYWPFR